MTPNANHPLKVEILINSTPASMERDTEAPISLIVRHLLNFMAMQPE